MTDLHQQIDVLAQIDSVHWDGISHHPDEYTAPQELELGVAVLAGTLDRLAR